MLKKLENILNDFNLDDANKPSKLDSIFILKVYYIRKLYKSNHIKIKDLKNFIDFNMAFLRKLVIEIEGNYNKVYDKLLYNFTTSLISGEIPLDEYMGISSFNLKRFILNDMYKSNMKVDYLINQFPFFIIANISPKKVKTMYKLFSKYSYNKDYSYEQMIRFFIRLSALVGEENADNIVRHLKDEKYKFDNLYRCIDSFDLSVIKHNDNKIVFDEKFIKFFIGSDLKQTQSVLNLVYENKFSLSQNLSRVYENFSMLYTRFRSQSHFTLLRFIEEKFKRTDYILNPNEYKLEGDIINAAVKDKSFQHLDDDKIVTNVRKTYESMKYSYKKSIPFIKGKYKGYTYFTLKANDPVIFSLGASTFCCFKIGGQGSLFLEYIASGNDGRILAIMDEANKICAMVPMVRNGNLILCNSVESRNIKNKKFMNDMFNILEEFSSKVLEISKASEPDNERISMVLCGNYKNNLNESRFEKINTDGLTSKLVAIGDKYNNLGSNLGLNAVGFYIIKKDSISQKLSQNNFFTPTIVYEDEFEINEFEVDMMSNEEKDNAQKVIDSINYELGKKSISVENLLKIDYTDNFYIAISKDYTIYHGIISQNPKEKKEYLEYLKLESEYLSYFNKASFKK